MRMRGNLERDQAVLGRMTDYAVYDLKCGIDRFLNFLFFPGAQKDLAAEILR